MLYEVITHALKTPFYRERLEGAGIRSSDDIETLADIRKIPFTANVITSYSIHYTKLYEAI